MAANALHPTIIGVPLGALSAMTENWRILAPEGMSFVVSKARSSRLAHQPSNSSTGVKRSARCFDVFRGATTNPLEWKTDGPAVEPVRWHRWRCGQIDGGRVT